MKQFILLVFLFLTSCSSEPDFAQRIGYFKSTDNGRALTFVLPQKYSIDEVKKHAQGQMNTQGKVTTVFYYEDINRAVDPTLMDASLYNVILDLSKSDYKYRYDKYPDGSDFLIEK